MQPYENNEVGKLNRYRIKSDERALTSPLRFSVDKLYDMQYSYIKYAKYYYTCIICAFFFAFRDYEKKFHVETATTPVIITFVLTTAT